LQSSILAILGLDRLTRLFYQRSNSGFDFAVALSRFQALAVSLYRRSVDYQRKPSKKKVCRLLTSAVAGVNVDGNPSMNPTAVSAAEDRFRDRFHSAFETIHFAIVADLPLSGRTKFAVACSTPGSEKAIWRVQSIEKIRLLHIGGSTKPSEKEPPTGRDFSVFSAVKLGNSVRRASFSLPAGLLHGLSTSY
jgi:hypothetical protein